MRIVKNKIHIGDVAVMDIAAEYGTPTYVYDENKIRENYRKAFKAFSKHYPDFRFSAACQK